MNSKFNIEFNITYNNIDDEDDSHHNFQNEFLKFFNIDSYDFAEIDPKLDILFEMLNSNESLKKILEKVNSNYNIEKSLQSVILLFSYDNFHIIYPLFQRLIDNQKVNEELINNTLNNLI